MSRKKNTLFKENLASELRLLAEVLTETNLVRDPGPLNAAADACTGGDLTSDQWEYTCSDLIFLVDSDHMSKYRKTLPPGLQEIEIELSVHAKGKCSERHSIKDPLEKLEVDCLITSRKKGVSYYCAWHLDRNIGNVEDESRNFVHPCYHFQYGGRKLPSEHGYGRYLWLAPPRLAHPPLDAVLAIDFVLTNYFPGTWRTLRTESDRYARIVRKAQHRCWRPYATATASGWGAPDDSWPAATIWPQLIPYE